MSLLNNKLKNLTVNYLGQLPQSDQHQVYIIKNRLGNVNERMFKILELVKEVEKIAWSNIYVSDVENHIQQNIRRAASEIYYHFQKTYGLKLVQNEYVESRQRTWHTDLDIEVVLKDIFNQLNGLSFQEYSKKQYIEDFRSLTVGWHTGEPDIEIKGNSIYFDCKIFGFSYMGYSINESARKLKAISLLCPHTLECIWEQYKLSDYTWRENYEPFQLYEVTDSEMFSGFKAYKNGKFQLKFVSKEKQLEFLRFFNLTKQ